MDVDVRVSPPDIYLLSVTAINPRVVSAWSSGDECKILSQCEQKNKNEEKLFQSHLCAFML